MKQFFTLFALFAFTLAGRAQWIDSMIVSPAMPDANDTVRIYVYLSFPQGNCADVAYSSVAGNTIYASTLHCMGAGMFICYDVDTLVIPPLTAGTYTLYFTLSAGYGPPGNCTPGFQPDDEDTLVFQVSTVLDIPEQVTPELKISPNPSSGNFQVQMTSGTIEQVEMVNTLGETVWSALPRNSSVQIPADNVATGLYFCRIIDSNGQIFVQRVEISR